MISAETWRNIQYLGDTLYEGLNNTKFRYLELANTSPAQIVTNVYSNILSIPHALSSTPALPTLIKNSFTIETLKRSAFYIGANICTVISTGLLAYYYHQNIKQTQSRFEEIKSKIAEFNTEEHVKVMQDLNVYQNRVIKFQKLLFGITLVGAIFPLPPLLMVGTSITAYITHMAVNNSLNRYDNMIKDLIIEDKSKEKTSMEEESRSLKERLSEREEAINALEGTLKQHKNNSRILEEEKLGLKDELDRAKANSANVDQRSSMNQKTINGLEETLKQRSEELETLQEEKLRIQAQLKEVKGQVKVVTLDTTILNKRFYNLQDWYDNSLLTIQHLEQQLSAAKEKLDQVLKVDKERTKEFKESTESIRQLHEAMLHLQAKLKEEESEIKVLSQQNKELVIKMEEKDIELLEQEEKTEVEKEKLEAEINELNTELTHKTKELLELRAQAENKQREIAAALDQAKQQANELNEQLNLLRHEEASLNQQLKDLESQKAELDKQLANLQKEHKQSVENFKKKSDKDYKDISLLTAKNAVLESQIREANELKAENQKQIDALNAKLNESKEQNSKLCEELEQLKQTHESALNEIKAISISNFKKVHEDYKAQLEKQQNLLIASREELKKVKSENGLLEFRLEANRNLKQEQKNETKFAINELNQIKGELEKAKKELAKVKRELKEAEQREEQLMELTRKCEVLLAVVDKTLNENNQLKKQIIEYRNKENQEALRQNPSEGSSLHISEKPKTKTITTQRTPISKTVQEIKRLFDSITPIINRHNDKVGTDLLSATQRSESFDIPSGASTPQPGASNSPEVRKDLTESFNVAAISSSSESESESESEVESPNSSPRGNPLITTSLQGHASLVHHNIEADSSSIISPLPNYEISPIKDILSSQKRAPSPLRGGM